MTCSKSQVAWHSRTTEPTIGPHDERICKKKEDLHNRHTKQEQSKSAHLKAMSFCFMTYCNERPAELNFFGIRRERKKFDEQKKKKTNIDVLQSLLLALKNELQSITKSE
jgi:hypothetical protein